MSHRTVTTAFTYVADPIKGSRFVADVAPVSDEPTALAFVEQVRARHPDASHHCWAFLLADADRNRCSDDGEPGGSAGRPILAQIEGHGLRDTVVVVSRWFGGTKLGVGGLIRAYGGTAGRALDRVETVQHVPRCELVLDFTYADIGPVQGVLNQHGLRSPEPTYGEAVSLALTLAETDVDPLVTALTDATAGRIRWTRTP